MNEKDNIHEKNNLRQTLASIASAFIGIQSNKNRERDFSQGKFSHFIIGGLIGVAAFIAFLVILVSLVLPS